MAVRGARAGWQLAECLLPGLTLATAETLGQRLQAEITGRPGSGVLLVGSVLMPEDEVLLVLFRGPQDAVRAVSERAGLPFDRIVSCVGIGWLPPPGRVAAAW
jgi:hypothetical protein